VLTASIIRAMSGSYRDEDVDCGLLGSDAMYSCMWLPTFRRNISPQSSGFTPCTVVRGYQRFGGTYHLHLQGSRRVLLYVITYVSLEYIASIFKVPSSYMLLAGKSIPKWTHSFAPDVPHSAPWIEQFARGSDLRQHRLKRGIRHRGLLSMSRDCTPRSI
jgi:hypothetical protein